MLAQEIREALPGVDDLLRADRPAGVEALLHWVAPRITFAGPPPAPVRVYEMGAAEMLHGGFDTGTFGVFCDGAADAFQKVLELFGVPSATVNLGSGLLEHTTVLVPADDEGGGFLLADPTFAMTLHDRDTGRPMSIERATRLMMAGRPQRIDVRTAGLGARKVLVGEDVVTCATTVRTLTPCGIGQYLAGYRKAIRAAGHRLDERLLVDVLAAEPTWLYRVTGPGLRAMEVLDALGADARLAPSRGRPQAAADAALGGRSRRGSTLRVRVRWHSVQPILEREVRWRRCGRRGCVALPGRSATRRVTSADVGSVLVGRSVAANAFGVSHADVRRDLRLRVHRTRDGVRCTGPEGERVRRVRWYDGRTGRRLPGAVVRRRSSGTARCTGVLAGVRGRADGAPAALGPRS